MAIKLQDSVAAASTHRNRGRILTALTVGVCAFLLFLFILWQHQTSEHPFPLSSAFNHQWTYQPSRDARNYGLSEEQCAIAFPKLYDPIEALMSRLPNGINYADTVGGSHWYETRAMVFDNEVYVLDDWAGELAKNRKFSTLQALNRAIVAVSSTGHRFPNIEFSLVSGDQNADLTRPNWAYDRKINDNLTVLIPDFGFYSWPAHNVGTYTEVRRQINAIESSKTFEEKIPQLIWRGTVDFGHEIRQALLNASNGKPWSAVKQIHWGASNFKDDTITMPEHCKYQFVAQTEGLSYSGRLKYLHNCESVIIAHDFQFETHDQHLMIPSGPEQNYVLVKRDFSDLSEKMDWLLAHPEEAARIARNNAMTFRDRYLSPAAEACYWRKLIHEWARKSTFEPEFYKNGTLQWRGVPLESWALERTLHWDAQHVG